MMHINGLLWCQQHRHWCQRELVIKLQVAQYELKPGSMKHKFNQQNMGLDDWGVRGNILLGSELKKNHFSLMDHE